MHDDSNIFFKLELIRHNKNLNVNIHLNPYAQNITSDDQTISWTPTRDEQAFLLECLQLIKQQEINATLIFNKKQQQFSQDHHTFKTNIKNKNDSQSTFICDEQNLDDKWESIDKIINKKLKISQ